MAFKLGKEKYESDTYADPTAIALLGKGLNPATLGSCALGITLKLPPAQALEALGGMAKGVDGGPVRVQEVHFQVQAPKDQGGAIKTVSSEKSLEILLGQEWIFVGEVTVERTVGTYQGNS